MWKRPVLNELLCTETSCFKFSVRVMTCYIVCFFLYNVLIVITRCARTIKKWFLVVLLVRKFLFNLNHITSVLSVIEICIFFFYNMILEKQTTLYVSIILNKLNYVWKLTLFSFFFYFPLETQWHARCSVNRK